MKIFPLLCNQLLPECEKFFFAVECPAVRQRIWNVEYEIGRKQPQEFRTIILFETRKGQLTCSHNGGVRHHLTPRGLSASNSIRPVGRAQPAQPFRKSVNNAFIT